MGKTFTHRMRVRYGECDPQNVVFNANYFGYFDVAITELWREIFGRYDAMLDSGTDMVVAEANARFLDAARFDDEIDIEIWLARLGTTGMTVELAIRREDEELVHGRMRYVFVDPATKLKKPIPDDIRTGLEPYLLEEAAAEAPA